MTLRYFFIQELFKEGRISIHYVKIEKKFAEIDIKHHSKHRHRYLTKLISDFKAWTAMLYILNNGGATSIYSLVNWLFFP